MSGPFSPARIAAKIEEMPHLSSKDIRVLRQRGEERGLAELIAACDQELARRPMEYDGKTALKMMEAEEHVAGFDLPTATRYAFTAFPASKPESRILAWLAANPGTSHADLIPIYGKGDLSLAVGHLVYDRMGCFAKFVTDATDDKSSVLIEKDRSGPSVRYTLRPEVIPVFRELGLA